VKHTSTRLIFDHWNRQRGARSAPTRSEIEPAAIRHALGDTFMLAADFIDGIRFRLAGTRVCALFGREIKGERFNALWKQAARRLRILAMQPSMRRLVPSPVLLDGPKRVQKPNWNCCCCRSARDGRARVRALGSLAPLAQPYWLGEEPIVELELQTLRHVGATQSEVPVPQFRSGAGLRMRHGFLVYSGGREIRPGDGTN
jgi:hypothetical protein